jgi:hypothetical protein
MFIDGNVSQFALFQYTLLDKILSLDIKKDFVERLHSASASNYYLY